MNRRQEKLLARVEATMHGATFWNEKDLTQALHIPPQATGQILAIGVQQGRIVRLAPGVLTLPVHLEALSEGFSTLGSTFTVADFRRATNLRRDLVIHVLDWFDAQGVTLRDGDSRKVVGHLRSDPTTE